MFETNGPTWCLLHIAHEHQTEMIGTATTHAFNPMADKFAKIEMIVLAALLFIARITGPSAITLQAGLHFPQKTGSQEMARGCCSY